MVKKYILPAFLFFGLSLTIQAQENLTEFGKVAQEESAEPIRPGVPGKTPFWNGKARQFIWAPAFEYKTIEGATTYQYIIKSEGKEYGFKSNIPYAPLSIVWKKMPVGTFTLNVVALDNKGTKIAEVGSGKYYKAAFFNGIYHEPVMSYDASARLALDHLLDEKYVKYWLENKQPDPKYANYKYPSKIYSALVIGAITHAKLKKGTADEKTSTELAKIVADFMLGIRNKKGLSWEYHVPTYYEKYNFPENKPHMDPANHFTIMGVDAGNAFLDMFDFTGDEKYKTAAELIAKTYLKTQLPEGSWYQFVNLSTGKPVSPNVVIPTSIINYFDRLRRDYNVTSLDASRDKALQWVMQNPVKDFNWQGQFEDIPAKGTYLNQSREQACDLAIYLFKNKQNISLAEELVRFSEDQFVIWEKPLPFIHGKAKDSSGYNSKNWITPSVQEQYSYFMPVGRAAGIMVETYWEAYRATEKEIYLAKAKSIANAFTLNQKANDGDYTTFFTPYKMNLWLNSVVYPAKVLMSLQNNLNDLEKSK